MSTTRQLVFRGEVLPGFRAEDVRRELGRLFDLDSRKLDLLFSGRSVVIKRGLAADEAQRYVERLASVGASAESVPGETAVSVSHAGTASSPTTETPPEEVVCPNCGERQSMRILCRGCATNMPMGLAAKREAAEQERLARLDAQRERHGNTGRDGSPSIWGFGLRGRVGRLPYAAAGALMLSLMLALLWFFVLRPGLARGLVMGAGLSWVLYQSMRLSALRCHDFNRSGWWSLLLLLPYVGLVAGLVVALIPGSDGDNHHGDPPRKGQWWQLGLSLVVFGVVLALSAPRLMEEMTRAAASGAAASAEAPESAIDEMSIVQHLGSREAIAAYLGEYVSAPPFKAFAISADGAWGWKSGAPSLDDAVAAAVSNCESHRRPSASPCVAVNINSVWVRVPTR